MSTRSTLTKSLLALGLLISVATLTACGQKQASTSTSSSSAKVTKTSSSSSLAKAKTSKNSSTQAENTETTTESSTTSETTATPNQTTSIATSSLDVQAIANGDLSTLAGTWKNGKGITIVIDGDKVTFVGTDTDANHYHLIESHTLADGRVEASLGFYNNDERQGGAGMTVVPAGVENTLGATSDVDHLEIGQSVNAANSDELFFRQ